MADYHLYAADISPYAQRVVLQLDYKGIPFTQAHPPGGFGSDEYGLINPIRKLPVLRIGDVHLPESEVIAEYIEQVHPEPPLHPEDPLERAHGRLISRIIDTYIMNPMMPLFANLSRRTRDQRVVDVALASIGKGLDALDNWISPGPYANGARPTLADFAAAPVLRYAAEYPPIFGMTDPFAGRSNIAAYYEAIGNDAHVAPAIRRIEAGWETLKRGAH